MPRKGTCIRSSTRSTRVLLIPLLAHKMVLGPTFTLNIQLLYMSWIPHKIYLVRQTMISRCVKWDQRFFKANAHKNAVNCGAGGVQEHKQKNRWPRAGSVPSAARLLGFETGHSARYCGFPSECLRLAVPSGSLGI